MLQTRVILFAQLLSLVLSKTQSEYGYPIKKCGILNAEDLLATLLEGKLPVRVLECGFGKGDRKEFEKEHIPGALFFDGLKCIRSSKDNSSHIPGVPPLSCFQNYAANVLKIAHGDYVVLYDSYSRAPGVIAARAFGYERVNVLNGGLGSWYDIGTTITESGNGTHSTVFGGEIKDPVIPIQFQMNFNLIATFNQVLENLKSRHYQLIDSRSAGEFLGRCRSEVAGQRVGHVPNAINVPFSEVLNIAEATFRNNKAMKAVFEECGVDIHRPTIVMCNMGMTASSVNIALYELGNRNVSIYCGSWREWNELAPDEYIVSPKRKSVKQFRFRLDDK